jgi:hypothetical protein
MRAEIRDTAVTHQNVKLSRGRHRSPRDGACVVELASMLAGERFSDHPRAVCPVVAAYLRTVNDLMPVDDLPELYPFAAAIVGTRGSRKEGRARARECARWASDLGADRRNVSLWVARRWGWGGSEVGSLCARAAIARGGHALALTLVESLLEKAPAEGADPVRPPTSSLSAGPAKG